MRLVGLKQSRVYQAQLFEFVPCGCRTIDGKAPLLSCGMGIVTRWRTPLIAGGVALFATACSGASGDGAVSSSTTSAVASPALTLDELDEIQQTLRSGDRGEVLQLLAIPKDPSFEVDDDAIEEVLELVQDVELQPDTLTELGDDTVSVVADVDGDSWLVYLVETDDQWQIAVTGERGSG